MKKHCNYALQADNSFGFAATTTAIVYPSTLADLRLLGTTLEQSFYVLGEGSNTLFCQDNAPLIIKPCFYGIDVTQTPDSYLVKAACAENWHALVVFCIEQGIYGLENLALIPGSVGAAPVQNIGAYGVEIARFIESISWFCFETQQLIEFPNHACEFGYRQSIFKQALNGRGIITHITLRLAKAWQPVLQYQGLNSLPAKVSAATIMAKVIEIRSEKLPDPKVLANAGSFFKNPIVSIAVFERLKQQYPKLPYYLQSNGEIKLAAGWLIEQSGLKGYQQGGVGVHTKQALVLVNYGQGSGPEMVELALHVQRVVQERFAISLSAEVRFIAKQGEVTMSMAGEL